mmetsp:Transcript_12064/g.23829  ORF Transcript_12064/g.23829 Transcript_12064/m.23829 type:complete len:202 (-) Transcript_12064:214-819(-)
MHTFTSCLDVSFPLSLCPLLPFASYQPSCHGTSPMSKRGLWDDLLPVVYEEPLLRHASTLSLTRCRVAPVVQLLFRVGYDQHPPLCQPSVTQKVRLPLILVVRGVQPQRVVRDDRHVLPVERLNYSVQLYNVVLRVLNRHCLGCQERVPTSHVAVLNQPHKVFRQVLPRYWIPPTHPAANWCSRRSPRVPARPSHSLYKGQ